MNLRDVMPLYDNLEKMNKLNSPIFQALAYMGNASHYQAWANTVISKHEEVPEAIKKRMKEISQQLTDIQEELRVLDAYKEEK